MLLLLFQWFYLSAVIEAEGDNVLNICSLVDPECGTEVGNCSLSVPCYHGICDAERNVCYCDSCWVGENCNHYIDKFPPRFLTSIERFTITPTTKHFQIPLAIDADGGTTCFFNDSCPCAKIYYFIRSGNEDDVFEINSSMGVLSVVDTTLLNPGSKWSLSIIASGVLYSSSDYYQDTKWNTLTVEIQVEDELPAIYDEGKIIRRRRATETDAVIQFQQIGDVTPTEISLGHGVLFIMKLTLPKTTILKKILTVELSARDPKTKESSFRLCNINVMDVGSGIKIENADWNLTAVQMLMNADQKWNDHAIVSFGPITVDENADDVARTLQITSAAIPVKSTTTDDKIIGAISGGASYDDTKKISIAQVELQSIIPKDYDYYNYPTNFTIDGPTTIESEASSIYLLNIFNTYPSDNFSIAVFSPRDSMFSPQEAGFLIDGFTIGNMRLIGKGDNFACQKDEPIKVQINNSILHEVPSIGFIDLGLIDNCALDRNETLLSPANRLQFEFTIYPTSESQNKLTFAVGAHVGLKTIWTALVNVTVTEKQQHDPITGSKVELVDRKIKVVKIPQNSVVNFQYRILYNTMASDFVPTVVKVAVVDNGHLSVCFARLIAKGFNIQYLPEFRPKFLNSTTNVNVTVEMTVDLGRVHITNQLTNNQSASSITIEVGIRAISHITVGESAHLGTEEYEVTSPKIITEPTMIYTASDIKVDVKQLLPSNIIPAGGETGVDVELTFPPGASFEPFGFEFSAKNGDKNDVITGRICRVQINHVGNHLPCLNQSGINNNILYSRSQDDYSFVDGAAMHFGGVYTTTEHSALNDDENKLTINIIAEVISRDNLAVSEYLFSAGFYVGGNLINIDLPKYSVAAADDIQFEQYKLATEFDMLDDRVHLGPLIQIHRHSEEPIPMNGVSYVFFHIKFPPRSRSTYKLTVTSQGAGLAICKMNILHAGSNLPCFDRLVYPGHHDPASTTFINYWPLEDETKGNNKAELNFGSLANIGDDPLITSKINDWNTISIGVGVKVLDSSDVGYFDLQHKFEYIGGEFSNETKIVIGGKEYESNDKLQVDFKSLDEKNEIYTNATTIIVLDLKIPSGFHSEIKATFKNLQPESGVGFCCGSVIFIGLNMPCVNASKIIPEMNAPETIGHLSCITKLNMDLGTVCHSKTSILGNSSLLRIEVGLNAPHSFTGEVTVSSTVVTGSQETFKDSLTLTASKEEFKPKQVTLRKSFLTPISKDDEIIEIPVSDKRWIPFNISIPPFASVPLTVIIQAPTDGGRAILTLYDLRVKETGLNVRCTRNDSYLDITTEESEFLATKTQNDTLIARFGFITNTGFTKKRNDHKRVDDILTLEVLVRMTDHPKVIPGAVFSLQITADCSSSGNATIDKKVSSLRQKDEIERIDFTALVIDQIPEYNNGQTVTIKLSVKHIRELSKLEPTSVFLQLLAPSFLVYKNHSINATAISWLQPENGFTQIEVTDFLFEDDFEIIFNLLVDPLSQRKPGTSAGITNLFARAVCQVRNDSSYPKEYHICAKPLALQINVGAIECNNPLGIGVDDCQISASSAISEDVVPDKGRRGAASRWSPTFRLNDESFYQIDFGNLTKVTAIEIECGDEENAVIKKLQPLQSFDGRHWTKVGEPITNDNLADHFTAPVSIKTRFLRLTVLEPIITKTSDKPMGARFEFYGCTQGSDTTVEAACSHVPKTVISTNASMYRHFTIDEEHDIAYVCDYVSVRSSTICFCSMSKGNTWRRLPDYISVLKGYDKEQKTVIAMDRREQLAVQSTNCHNWTLVDEVSSGVSSPSIVFPGETLKDMPTISPIGNWKADFDGIKYKNQLKFSWANVRLE